MAVRIKDGMIPYTWGVGIEITNNHVINVLLREMNNLIHVNEDRELYVDLQLDDGIEPDADFPVGVTTWRILQEDWRQESGQILNWKTTSWDYTRLINADDWNLYVDLGDGNRILLWGSSGWISDINTKTFYIENNSDLTTAQSAYDWYDDGKDAILSYWDSIYVLVDSTSSSWTTTLEFRNNKTVIENWISDSCSLQDKILLAIDEALGEVTSITIGTVEVTPHVLATGVDYTNPYVPEYDGSPATKMYVDQGLAWKQDVLTAGTRIIIDQNNVISADISGVFIYKGNVTDSSALPSSWNTVGDCYITEDTHMMYAWDGTQWKQIWSTAIDLTNYFNKTVDDSDDIVPWSVHLFVTPQEKTYWNWKQDKLTAGENINISQSNVISSPSYTEGDGIDITNHVVTNTAKFDPENAGSLGQFLKKTSTGYTWADIPWWWGWGWGSSYTAWNWISISNHVITNIKPFEPIGNGQMGQVLKKTADGYTWANESGSEQDVRVWNIPQNGFSQATMQEITQWLLDAWDLEKSAILKSERAGNTNLYIYGWRNTIDGTTNYNFYWMWEKHEKNTTSANGDFTTMYNTQYVISFDGTTYTGQSITATEPNGNYLTVEDSGYTTPYMPTEPYQPATKAYVDAVAAGSVSVWAITNNTTGTNLTLQQEWVGTQAQYNQITPINWVIYNIIPSN